MSRDLSIKDYVERGWKVLERSSKHLVDAATDPKLGLLERYPVFVSLDEPLEELRQSLAEALGTKEMSRIELKVLPRDIKVNPQLKGGIKAHGLLYLPNPYIVPGGRFNEMYGWDSYFINLGLLASGRFKEAKAMVDNHLYQVRHYGRVLNANRTYYLTRSQPPFLASMVADIWRREKNRQWLESALPELEETYSFWTNEPHLTPETGLSRYYDLGSGPADEVIASERDEQGLTHYDRIREEFLRLGELPVASRNAELGYPLELYFDLEAKELTPLFYAGDRAMRESGYDPSDRFGRFNVDVTFFNPVDLNSLLYVYELQMGRIYSALKTDAEAKLWRERASFRAGLMQRYLWQEESGLFLDYNLRDKHLRYYPFATTFFPLFAGWASPEEARRVHANLSLFERPGGLVTSLKASGNQWDAPFGWAPLQLVAVEGLKNYGYDKSARRLAQAFVAMVEKEYERTGTIVEKYDVEKCSVEVSKDIAFGYSSNEIGFGWTNGVYLIFKEQLSPSAGP